MPTQLTMEQHADLEQHGDKPVPVVDPVNQKVYFLVAGEMYHRLKCLFDEEPFDIRETYVAQEQAFAKIWDDPALDVYPGDGG
jgi:hypothetical protein